MRYLGIDYGAKRVGLALSDESGALAFPHAVLKNSQTLPDEIAQICKKKEAGIIVIGESRDFKGKPNPVMKGILSLKKELEKRTGLPVFLEPEFLTTVQAARWQGKTDKLDASAAALILQSYLDKVCR